MKKQNEGANTLLKHSITYSTRWIELCAFAFACRCTKLFSKTFFFVFCSTVFPNSSGLTCFQKLRANKMLRLNFCYFFPVCTCQFQIINCHTKCLIILIPARTYFISHFLSGCVGRLWPALPPGRHHSVQANRHKGHVLQSGRICQSPQHHQGPLQRISPAGEGGKVFFFFISIF